MLSEEVGQRDERARRGRVELVGRVREGDDIAGPSRVGHVGGRVRTVGNESRLRLREDAIDDGPALGRAVAGPVVRIGESFESGLDGSHRGDLVRRRHLLHRRISGVAALEVEIDLHRSAGPAGLRLANRLAGPCSAVGGLRRGEQPHVDEHLARIDREELRREAVIRANEGRRLVGHVRLDQGQGRIGPFVRAADETLARARLAVRGAVHLDVVVGGIRVAVR